MEIDMVLSLYKNCGINIFPDIKLSYLENANYVALVNDSPGKHQIFPSHLDDSVDIFWIASVDPIQISWANLN